MNTHFDILIDASGSMGYFKDKDGNLDKRALLPDGKTTRTELVKKILVNSLLPKMSFVDTLKISTFSSKLILDNFGKPKLKSGNKQYSPNISEVFEGKYSLSKLKSSIDLINNPDEALTPLSWATSVIINQSKQEKINLIILSDGADSMISDFDEAILKTIGSKKCVIYFIGISQNENSQKKSKNLSDSTGGKYVNLNAINYNEILFDNFLFDFNATITSNALRESLKIPTSVDNIIEENKEHETIEEVKSQLILEKKFEAFDIKRQVAENTKSLQLISSQLDQIVKQVSFIGNNKSKDEDEFEANEDEEFNKLVGNKTERILFEVLKSKWKDTTWLNENGEQGKPYDFEVLFEGQTYYMECKGTVKNIKEFFLTKNEWLFYLANRGNFRLYFVSEINSQNPLVHRIEDLLKDMEKGKLIPCSSVNRKVKADRILFQIID